VLRPRTRICGSICIEVLAIANIGFIGFEPGIIISHYILKNSRKFKARDVVRILDDGDRVVMENSRLYRD